MNLLTKALSILLGISSENADGLANEIAPKLEPVIRFISRIFVFAMFIICLYREPEIAILIGILVYFIVSLESRVSMLEKELQVERRLNREAYSTERYTARQGDREQNKGYSGTVKLRE